MVRTMGSWQPRYRVPELRLALQAGFAEIASLSGAESVVKDRIFIRTNCRVVRFLVSSALSKQTAQVIEVSKAPWDAVAETRFLRREFGVIWYYVEFSGRVAVKVAWLPCLPGSKWRPGPPGFSRGTR